MLCKIRNHKKRDIGLLSFTSFRSIYSHILINWQFPLRQVRNCPFGDFPGGVLSYNHYITMQVCAYRLVYVGSFPQKTLDRIDVSILRRGMERCSSLVGFCIHIKPLVQQVIHNTVVATEKTILLVSLI